MKNSYTESLSHTTWECKYHVVFAPKFRRQEIYGELKKEIGLIIRELCRRKEVEIIEAEACVNVNIKMNIFSNLIMQKNLHFYIVIHHRFWKEIYL